MSLTWEITELLKKILNEISSSNVIQAEALDLHKQHFRAWQEVAKGITEATERGMGEVAQELRSIRGEG